MAESVHAAGERGVDITDHVARELTRDQAEGTDLVLGMGGDHRAQIDAWGPAIEAKTFTLKELVRLLEHLGAPPPGMGPDRLPDRVLAADAARRDGFPGNPADEDVADPLGLPLSSYRAIAWELDGWVSRLVDGLFGAVPAVAEA
jgi:protein-tyrosine-phosphatase